MQRYFSQYIRSGCAALLLLAAAPQASGQLLPTGNIPQTPAASTPAAVPYYGLYNLSTTGRYNYIRTIVPDQPLQQLGTGSSYYYRQSADYFDGLGRPLQTVVRKGHADGNDLVSVYTYDSMGRNSYQYQPYAAPLNGVFAGTQAGWLRTADSNQMRLFYDHEGPDEQPYGLTLFEPSALGRPVQVMGPGGSWAGDSLGKTFNYFTNYQWIYNSGGVSRLLSGGFPRFTMGNTAGALPVFAGAYGANQLSITQVIDEDGKENLEVKDKEGRIVMKLAGLTANHWGATRPMDYAYTVYIHDALGRVRCVLSPEAVKQLASAADSYGSVGWSTPISQAQLDGLCYTYLYDERSRLVEKKVPGKAVEYFIYDQRDRLSLYQDGNLRALGKWQFTLYDGLDRPIVTGTGDDGSPSRQVTLDWYNSFTSTSPSNLYYYIKNYNLYHAYPASLTSCTILSYLYYDDYLWTSDFTGVQFDASTFGITSNLPVTVVPSVLSAVFRGRLTGSRVRITNGEQGITDQWLTSAVYYDDKGRVIQTATQNLDGGSDRSSNIYYFQGMLFQNILDHRNPKARIIPGATDSALTIFSIVNTYERNLALGGGNELVKRHTQRINNGNEYELSRYSYDHLGRNTLKQWTAGLNLNAWNMRGFLDTIIFRKTDLDTAFYEALFYDKGFRDHLFNGNIAGITWAGANHIKRSYGYTYDNLNRLTHAEFNQYTNNIWNKTAGYDYTMSGVSYDLNGNIRTMKQRGRSSGATAAITMDSMIYTYAAASNQLYNVRDYGSIDAQLPDFKDDAAHSAASVQEYSFDPNGNLKWDNNKGIGDISYNYQNKPLRITVTGKGVLYNTYDAEGNLLRKVTDDAVSGQRDTTDYIGPFVYRNNELQFVNNEEGRARPIVASHDNFAEVPLNAHYTKFVYDYFVKDHLGNVRSTVTATPLAYAYLASHNISAAGIENLLFDNIPTVRDNKPGSGAPDDMAARLNAAEADHTVGTAIMLAANPGDRFKLSVSGFYDGDYEQQDDDALPASQLVQSLFDVLSQGSLIGGKVGEGLPADNVNFISDLFSDPNLPQQVAALYSQSNNLDAPRAHLTYLWFDDRMQLDLAHSGSVQVSQAPGGWSVIQPVWAGGNTGTGVTGNGSLTNFDEGVLVAPGNGTLVVYIDNQSIGKDVWFDNLSVSHFSGSVIEESHYYPFGLTQNVTSLPTGVNLQPIKYNGIELEKHFGLEMLDAYYRYDDPQLGRYWQTDPKYAYDLSPYSSRANNPVLFSDPLGDTTWVYGRNGGMLGTVNDNLPNQIHFLSIDADKDKTPWTLSDGENVDANAWGERIRDASTAFIGENSVNDLREMSKDAENSEIGFVGAISKTKEIRFTKLPDKYRNPNDKNGYLLKTAIRETFNTKEQIGLFTAGHFHPTSSSSTSSVNGFTGAYGKLLELGTPTGGPDSNYGDADYQPMLMRNNGSLYPGQSPAFIGTKYGFSIYGTGTSYNDDYAPNKVMPSIKDYYQYKQLKR